jgi:hypothetical protein
MQFTILNFVRFKSWPIAQYSFISALSPTKREGAFAALIIAALFAQTAVSRGEGCLPSAAARTRTSGGGVAHFGRRITRKIKIDAVRNSISGSHAVNANACSGALTGNSCLPDTDEFRAI